MTALLESDRAILQSEARAWKRIGCLGANIVSREYSGRRIVECLGNRRPIYLGEYDTAADADRYAEACRRFLEREYDRA